MENSRDLVEVMRAEGPVGFLDSLLRNADQVGTGVLAMIVESGKLAPFLIGGRLVQAARSGQFFVQLASEVEELRLAGKISTDYMTSDQATACFQELLAALEEPPVDEIKFKALKAVFLAACTEDISNRDDLEPRLLMGVVRELTTGEITVLGQVFKGIEQTVSPTGTLGAHAWMTEISAQCGFKAAEMAAVYFERLLDRKLVSGTRHPDGSVSVGKRPQVTGLGQRICVFMQHYDGNLEPQIVRS